MKSFRAVIIETMREHDIPLHQMADAFEAVSDCIRIAAERVKTAYPTATKTIERLQEVGRDIEDLDEFIERFDYPDHEDTSTT